MKRVLFVLSALMVLTLFACNNEASKEEAKPTDTVATAAAEPEAKPAFIPFKIVAIQHKVKNFEKSVAGYFSRDSLLNAHGISHFVFARDLKDSNLVFIIDKIDDMERTKKFFTDTKVQEAMKKAGVSSPPGYSYGEMVRSNDAPRQYAEGLSVAHHVKDFDAWLKTFDANGPSTRATHGLIDRGIVRDLNDPNMVYVIFEISDLEKAKARMASPELKKIMEDAGVDSPPTIRWFKIVK